MTTVTVTAPEFTTGGPQGPGMIAPVVVVYKSAAEYTSGTVIDFKLPILTGLKIKAVATNYISGTAAITPGVIALSTQATYEKVSVTLGAAMKIGDQFGIVAYYGIDLV